MEKLLTALAKLDLESERVRKKVEIVGDKGQDLTIGLLELETRLSKSCSARQSADVVGLERDINEAMLGLRGTLSNFRSIDINGL